MKTLIKNSLLILFIALFTLQLPVFAQNTEDFIESFKEEISKKHKLLNFETRKISAIYPSNVINRLGMNYPGQRGPGQLAIYYPESCEQTGTNE